MSPAKKKTNTSKAPAVTDVKKWKEKAKGQPLELPSGHTCLARAVGMQVFMKSGIVPNSLLSTVQQALMGNKMPELDEVMADDPKRLEEFMEMFDRVVCFCVVEPKVEMPPPDEEAREEDVLYADEVDMDDKMFIFQFAVGGTRDLESFRSQVTEQLASLPTGTKLEGETVTTT